MFSKPAVLNALAVTSRNNTSEMMDFEALANKHKDAVYRQMLRACGNHEDAEDVLVEALFRAYRHLDQLEQPEAFRAWLAAIGRRVCWHLKRREKVLPLIQLSQMEHEGLEIRSTGPASDTQWEAIEMKRHLERALAAMPEEYRRVYEMRDLEDQSGEKVAEALGISVPAMKSRLHRARAFVRERLDGVIRGNYESLEGAREDGSHSRASRSRTV